MAQPSSIQARLSTSRLKANATWALALLIGGMILGSLGQLSPARAIARQTRENSSSAFPPEVSQDTGPKRTDQLIEQLGSSRFQIRQNAAEQLWQMGVASRAALARAATHPDQEIAKRAKEILVALDWGFRDPASPEVSKLVSIFHESGPLVRRGMLTQLIQHRRFKLSFQLLATVDDTTERHELYRDSFDLSELAVLLARRNDWDELAFVFTHPICLEFDTMTCVYFHWASGNLAALTDRLQQVLSARENDGLTIDPNQRFQLIQLLRIQ
jgi:hypothetical protein